MKVQNRLKRIVGAVVGAALALGSSAAVVATANADDTTDASDLAALNIDTSQTGSITVHKYQGAEWDQSTYPADGNEITSVPEGATPLANVTFQLQQVDGVDLSNYAQWQTLKGLEYNDGTVSNASNTSATYTLGTAQDVVTNAQGIATFSNLPVGVYLVQETKAPSNVTSKTAPFFVTIPFPNTNANGDLQNWNYNVNVYPKNSVTEVTKNVDTTGSYTVGQDITWNIGIKIPQGEQALQSITATDTLVPETSYVSSTVTLGDQTLNVTPTVGTPGANGTQVTYNFSGTDLMNTINAAAGQTIKIALKVKVNSIPSSGEITNGTPDQPALTVNFQYPGKTPVPVNPPTPTPAEYGNFIVHKYTGGTAGNYQSTGAQPLANATFAVYATEADANSQQNAVETVTSNAQGVAEFTNLKTGTYYLRETAAPAGYKTIDTVNQITVVKGAANATSISIQNTAYNRGELPKLPLTGATGTVILSVGGVLLVAAGVALFLASRRRNSAR